MVLKQIQLNHYTVFENHLIEFSDGVNIFIGENGTGKTHMMKLLYSACQAADPKVSFPYKIVMTMLPDDFKIARLITRKPEIATASVRIEAKGTKVERIKENIALSASFHEKTRKWEAEVAGESMWEEAFAGTNSVFVPAKEILSNSYNLNAAVDKNNVRFDDTYLDILNAAKIDLSSEDTCLKQEALLKKLEQVMDGITVYDMARDEFYLKKGTLYQEFNLVAEGIRKIALLWKLIQNGNLETGAVLFWDEPEANINPSYLSVLVEVLLALQRKGVQIFISTHDYMLASYFQVRRKKEDHILFHSFDKRQGGTLQYTCNEKFADLSNNVITMVFDQLLDEIYEL